MIDCLFNLQVDLAHLLASRDQELRALTAEVTMFTEVLLSCYTCLRKLDYMDTMHILYTVFFVN